VKERACLEIERLLLGAIVHAASDEHGNTAADVVLPLLKPADFADPANGAVLQAAQRIHRERSPMVPAQVIRALRESNALNAVGERYVGELPAYRSGLHGLDAHVVTLKAAARARRFARAAHTVISFNDASVSNEEFVFRAKRYLDQAAEDDAAGIEFESAAAGFEQIYDACASGQKPQVWFTGFEKLDTTLGGFSPGTLNILAARPGVGKTSLAATLAFNGAGLSQVPALMFSLEMRAIDIWARLMAGRAEVKHDLIRRREVEPPDMNKMAAAAEQASRFPFHVHKPRAGQPRPSVDEMRAIAAAFKRKHGGLSFLVVDYIQLAVQSGEDSLVERIGEITAGLKLLSTELECAVLALSQFNREPTKSEGARPHMGQLRGSGAIEQDADTVILLWKPKRGTKGKQGIALPDGYVEAIIDKNRNGPTGMVKLKFAEWFTRFEEMEAVDPSPGNHWDQSGDLPE
jgi:replicative DNA helicase